MLTIVTSTQITIVVHLNFAVLVAGSKPGLTIKLAALVRGPTTIVSAMSEQA